MHLCLHELVERQAAKTPSAVAVTVASSHTTYATLDERANHSAHRLAGIGASGSLVGVAVDRSVDTIVALLGILKAGGAYVPFACDLPAERVRRILGDAGVDIVVGSGPALSAAGDLNRRVVPVAQTGEREPPRVDVRSDDVAYVIYTSGSTGAPKGVVTPHRQIVHSTLARFDVFPLPCTSYLMLAPFTFDASAAGTYLALASGGRLVVPTDEEVLDPALLAVLAAREGVSHLDGVPSQYAALVAFHPEALRGLRCCILAGEALPQALVERHYEVAPDTPLFNEYGPTEGTVWSAVHRCSPADGGSTAPIGRAIRGVRLHILDGELRPVAAGEPGEIHIAGAGLARGYLNRPELTADRFIPNPFAERPGERLYRTGDLGTLNELGDVVYLGRRDAQVKVRGFRVELAEVEANLVAHPAVSAAAVAAIQLEAGVRLVGYVVARDGVAPSSEDLAAFLAARLPPYMVPAMWQVLDGLPLTSHGKVDRRRLPRPAAGSLMSPGSQSDEAGSLPHAVVANGDGDWSVWPLDRALPVGWRRDGRRGTRSECLSWIRRRPRPALAAT